MSDSPRHIAFATAAARAPDRRANLTVPGCADADFLFFDIADGRVAWVLDFHAGHPCEAGGVAKSRESEQGAAKMGTLDAWRNA